jgi:RNA polymerase sigma-70 factor (family 1)
LLPNKVHTIPDPFLLFRQGKEAGFTHYFKEFYAPLTYFAQGILKSNHLAEDIVEDSFIKLWERHPQFESASSIRAYLYTTVRNASIDLLRREKRKLAYLETAQETQEREEKPVINRIIEAESMHRIYTAVEALPLRCGTIFRLFYLEGKSLKEISEELGIATTTVISQKKRAIQILQKNLPPKEVLLVVVWFMS